MSDDAKAIDDSTGVPGLGEAYEQTSRQMAAKLRACAGLDLPADVPEGAVLRLVEAAEEFLFRYGCDPTSEKLRAALRELGRE